MTGAGWIATGSTTLLVLLLAFVAVGALPVVMTAYQFLLIPFQAVVNHYKKAGPYLPRVAIIIPAWNEGAVIGTSIDRLMALEYPRDRLRIYVVDDASVDSTPDVVRAKAATYPGAVFHLRREIGGEGKAQTLNHGIRVALADDWMQALLIMDADVIYQPDSLRRMTRHLADPEIGAVTAYIAEGSSDKNYLTRFIGMDYVITQVAGRRAQNVIGAVACLVGGAQLHSRDNLVAIGGRIDTSSLGEDTVTTFETQLAGRRVVFEPHAVVLAEEPQLVSSLWTQRLRWSRGNVDVTRRYSKIWFRPSLAHRIGSFSFGLVWFSSFLLPIAMVLSSIGLVGLYFLHAAVAAIAFRVLWSAVAFTYIYSMSFAVQLDSRTGRRSWREALLFPGFISLVVMIAAVFPGLLEHRVPAMLGVAVNPVFLEISTLFLYVWMSLGMLGAWLAKVVEKTWIGPFLTPFLVYLVGFSSLLRAITVHSYIKELRHADASWDKTEKIGRVA